MKVHDHNEWLSEPPTLLKFYGVSSGLHVPCTVLTPLYIPICPRSIDDLAAAGIAAVWIHVQVLKCGRLHQKMRPHHFILVCLGVVGLPTLLTFFSLLHSHPRGQVATEAVSDSPKNGVRALFSFHTPSTLFPPSAIISLTDDNSTFFLARPSDFGPPLSANGLSGQLWVGSGFAADDIGRGGADTGAEGELGCSDVPGWEGGSQLYRRDSGVDQEPVNQGINKVDLQADPPTNLADLKSESMAEPSEGDGTDDHLHHPLPTSPVSRPAEFGLSSQHPPPEDGQASTHADIQSLQESAEIKGKVVLLSRGGCGFLEKVKWAQRRGATALIVGDHTRGGALITMYARGDTSNVTIPSLFTSHTTAHLLSSLIPLDSYSDTLDEAESIGKEVDWERPRIKGNGDRPTFTPAALPKPTGSPASSRAKARSKVHPAREEQTHGWVRSLFGTRNKFHTSGKAEDSRRPPSSGRLDWFSEKLTDDSLEEKLVNYDQDGKVKEKGKLKIGIGSKEVSKSGTFPNPGDDFIIGVQDWRDPDLVAAKSSSKTKSTTTTVATSPTPLASKALYKGGDSVDPKLETALRGGSITPGSGQYHKPGSKAESHGSSTKGAVEDYSKQQTTDTKSAAAAQVADMDRFKQDLEEHEGLWVTLTPTTMSTSPFFDTLLVLVVSPLITLTVVYALLLLRSRLRRRRWRAPKSVVDRLPIRTYHTMSCASTTSSSRSATPHSSSPASPLLLSSARSVTARSRPRSATASGIEDAIPAPLDQATKPLAAQQEKPASVKVKRKYHGKQIECVVCLEEYVDGESKVMSLPCGHEFHAHCM